VPIIFMSLRLCRCRALAGVGRLPSHRVLFGGYGTTRFLSSDIFRNCPPSAAAVYTVVPPQNYIRM
jgi:hypothetical protein